MKRARYFPPKKPQMCWEYCPICKRICELPAEHNWADDGKGTNFATHVCPMEHTWQ